MNKNVNQMQGNTEDYKKTFLIMSHILGKEFITKYFTKGIFYKNSFYGRDILQKHGKVAAPYFQGCLKESNNFRPAAVGFFFFFFFYKNSII